MTAFALLGYIVAALLAQLIVVFFFVVLRRNSAALPILEAVRIDRPDASAAWPGLRDFRVRSRVFEDAAASQLSFYLEPVDGLPLAPYKAGQFLTFHLDLPDPQGNTRPVTRCYSLSDCHDPAAYRITIKRIPAPDDRPDLPPGLVSNHFHASAIPGTVVQVRAPAGVFTLHDDARIPSVLVAGGIGITPLFAMARAALAKRPDRAIHLFYGVRDSREAVFKTALMGMRERHPNFQVTFVESRPVPDELESNAVDAAGFIDVALLRRLLPHGNHYFYVCGPPPMMASLVPALRDWGVAADAVRYEAFGPASIESAELVAAIPLDTPLEVQFAGAGRTLSWTGDDTNLLDFAEHHGVDVASGCRSGSCGTCETAVNSGSVRYAQQPSFDVAPGHCLLCVGVPSTDLVLDA